MSQTVVAAVTKSMMHANYATFDMRFTFVTGCWYVIDINYFPG